MPKAYPYRKTVESGGFPLQFNEILKQVQDDTCPGNTEVSSTKRKQTTPSSFVCHPFGEGEYFYPGNEGVSATPTWNGKHSATTPPGESRFSATNGLGDP